MIFTSDKWAIFQNIIIILHFFYILVVIENLANLSVDDERNKQLPEIPRNTSDDKELTDLVKSLKEQLQMLRDQNRNLKGKVEEEVQARKRLENILKNNVLPNRNDIEWNED